MSEYRRCVRSARKDDLWHWHPDCESYPMKTFAIRKDKPPIGDLCAQCAACAEEMKQRSVA